ncbi:MAG: hypothetical protein EHM61_28275, partial [Acidobacteria bacterium]
MQTVDQRIAKELGVREEQVTAAIRLLDEGATVPFVARYRKEATGALDDTQLRRLQERLRYLRELDERREVVLRTVQEQGKLTPELEAAVKAAETKVALEDLYLPFKPKRRTKAQIAREHGLEPLARSLFENPELVPEEAAAAYVDVEKGVPDISAALDGARHILMEEFSEKADLVGSLREYVWEKGILRSRVVAGKEDAGVKYADYFDVDQPLKNIPSHRALALFRGRREGFLKLALVVDPAAEPPRRPHADKSVPVPEEKQAAGSPAGSASAAQLTEPQTIALRAPAPAEPPSVASAEGEAAPAAEPTPDLTAQAPQTVETPVPATGEASSEPVDGQGVPAPEPTTDLAAEAQGPVASEEPVQPPATNSAAPTESPAVTEPPAVSESSA